MSGGVVSRPLASLLDVLDVCVIYPRSLYDTALCGRCASSLARGPDLLPAHIAGSGAVIPPSSEGAGWYCGVP